MDLWEAVAPHVREEGLYFKVIPVNGCAGYDTHYATDSLTASDHAQPVSIRDTDTNYLVVEDGELEFTNDKCDCSFSIQTYSDSHPNFGGASCLDLGSNGPKAGGRAVTLCVTQDKQKTLVCCSEDGVQLRKMEIQKRIDEPGHQAVFYMRVVCGYSHRGWHTMESSLYRGRYLGVEDGKLVLREKCCQACYLVVLKNG